ncbi:protein arginine N-methyltransferase 2 isoform X2 [Dendropsophus ebraccatus]|uniref:protein arginine N-methyltransferase 2 isoform X2 n=1 Tax=Dendropsophus ebraccatus TaxID=150705 RepID=UPI0038322FBE
MDVQSILGVVLELESELGKNDGQPIEPHGIHHSGGRYLGIHHRDGGRYSGIHHRDGGRYSGIHHRDGGRYSGIHHRDGGRYSGIHHRDGDRCSADAKFKGTEAAGDRERGRNPGDEESHGVDDDHGHYVSSDIAEDRALGHGGGDIDESLVRGTVRDPLVPPVREVGDLSRTGQSVYSQMEGGREEMKRTEGLDGACPAKEYTAETSYKKFPGAACLALSRPGDSIVDYPYVDFSSSQLMVMGDFVAADDTQLSLSQGDTVHVLNAVTPDWWWVEHNGRCGYAPASHLHGVYVEEGSDIDDPWQDEEYYGSYKTLKLHLEMLSDQPRTEAYRNVIMQNSTALKGKRILDLGCGTGIISFFCAQLAEPEIVYAVEASEISKQTRKLVEKNGFSSVVHVLCQRAEELQLPSKVDVLVSEWMGTCLVFEFMLESVLLARDLCLKEDGVMWPSTACVHLVPCSADEVYASRVLFWDALYGLDFSALKPMAIQEFFARPKPDYVLKPEDCLSQPCTLLDVNMKTLNIEDLEKMNSEFQFHVDRDGTFHGFTAWFSVQFQNIDNQDKVELNTGPFNPLTHWKHTLFMLDKPLQVHMGDQITGSVVFKRNPLWRRHLSVTITWSVTSSSLTPVQNGCKVFPIWR